MFAFHGRDGLRAVRIVLELVLPSEPFYQPPLL